jgi:hypothetical protein
MLSKTTVLADAGAASAIEPMSAVTRKVEITLFPTSMLQQMQTRVSSEVA